MRLDFISFEFDQHQSDQRIKSHLDIQEKQDRTASFRNLDGGLGCMINMVYPNRTSKQNKCLCKRT